MVALLSAACLSACSGGSSSEGSIIKEADCADLTDEMLDEFSELVDGKTFNDGDVIKLSDLKLQKLSDESKKSFSYVYTKIGNYNADKNEITISGKTEVKFTSTETNFSIEVYITK